MTEKISGGAFKQMVAFGAVMKPPEIQRTTGLERL